MLTLQSLRARGRNFVIKTTVDIISRMVLAKRIVLCQKPERNKEDGSRTEKPQGEHRHVSEYPFYP